jgi:hypothetical protein
LNQRKSKLAPAEETRRRRVLTRQGVEDDPLLLKNHLDPGRGKVDLVACTAMKNVENKLERLCVFGCKCLVNPCAVVQKTLRKVKITHLEAVDERRPSLDIILADADANVHLRVDKGLQGRNVAVPQVIEKRGPAPRETIDGGDIRTLADDPEENSVAADKGRIMEEGSAFDNKIRRK